MSPEPIAGGAQWIDTCVKLLPQGFQGYVTATCGFRDGYGFAFISATALAQKLPTLAQGYLAVMHGGGSTA